MSYESTNYIDAGIPFVRVKDVVELLGYEPINDGFFKLKNEVATYAWFDSDEYKSYVGVYLIICRDADMMISVYTRSTASRSYWDLVHQNKTIKILRDLLGGYFVTDAGKNRYYHPHDDPPPSVVSGCYLAKWHYYNGLEKLKMYLSGKEVKTFLLTGHKLFDEFNPLLLSNNLTVPYLVAVWEEFFKSSFVALLKYSSNRDKVFKRAKVKDSFLELIADAKLTVEEACAESLSFQRPEIIIKNFGLIDTKIDLHAAFVKPYRRRKVSLLESITKTVELRNLLVHTGNVDISLSDTALKRLVSDFEEIVDRSYLEFGRFLEYDFCQYGYGFPL